MQLTSIQDATKQSIGVAFDSALDSINTCKTVGFVNIPSQYSDYFPADREIINVQFGPYMLQGFVNRINTNGYPRVQ